MHRLLSCHHRLHLSRQGRSRQLLRIHPRRHEVHMQEQCHRHLAQSDQWETPRFLQADLCTVHLPHSIPHTLLQHLLPCLRNRDTLHRLSCKNRGPYHHMIPLDFHPCYQAFPIVGWMWDLPMIWNPISNGCQNIDQPTLGLLPQSLW